MTNEQIKTKWSELMGPIASGHATLAMVRAFDSLTSQVYGARAITFEEFLSAQTVISVARDAAKAAKSAGLEGHFLAKE